jgi:hypothetical protein
MQRKIQVGILGGTGRGENPYYFTDGITATTKQIASARFGVTAEYIISGRELQIKVAQGAKPGEGGQLMSVKVLPEIARARYSLPHVSLISPHRHSGPSIRRYVAGISDLNKQILEDMRKAPATREPAAFTYDITTADRVGAGADCRERRRRTAPARCEGSAHRGCSLPQAPRRASGSRRPPCLQPRGRFRAPGLRAAPACILVTLWYEF